MNIDEFSNKKVVNINTNTKKFFQHWLTFTTPFHKLAKKPQQILALLLYHHYVLGKEITNNKILWKQVFDYDTKVKIANELDIKQSYLENVLSQLRKSRIIEDNKISEVYIPRITIKDKGFTVKYNFIFKNE